MNYKCTIGCDFINSLNTLDNCHFTSGEGEISGNLMIFESDKLRMDFGDGWSNYGSIELNFCPVCGKKIQKNTI